MKIRLAVFATQQEAEAALTIKVNAPRRQVFRKGSGGAKFLQQKRKKAQQYRRTKNKVLRNSKLYRKRNKLALERRAKFLQKAPKKPVKSR